MEFTCQNMWCLKSFADRNQLWYYRRNCRRTLRIVRDAAVQDRAAPVTTGTASSQQPMSPSSSSPCSAEASPPATDVPMPDCSPDELEAQHLAFLEQCYQARAADAQSTPGVTKEVMGFLMRVLPGETTDAAMMTFIDIQALIRFATVTAISH